MDSYLTRLTGFGWAGLALVARNDAVELSKGYGMANREAGRPFSNRTLFDIGSLTKQFTAAAVMRLVADGKLSVRDSLGKFFSGVPQDKNGVTVFHLLTHTSGLPEALGGDYRPLTRDSLLAMAFRATLRSAPGATFLYSNPGFSLLAAVIERVSGQPYEAFLKAQLFQPAGMRETGYLPDESRRSDITISYVNGTRWGSGVDSTRGAGQYWNLVGNGGIHSSTSDLHRWIQALKAGRVLPPPIVSEMFFPRVLVLQKYRGSDAQLFYGYGWYVWKHPDQTVVFHNGSNGIFFTSLRLYAESGGLLAFTSNESRFADASLSATLDSVLMGKMIALPPIVSHRGAGRVNAGRYVHQPSGAALEVTADEAGLLVEAEGQLAFSFVTRDTAFVAGLDSLNSKTARFMHLSRRGAFDSLRIFLPSIWTIEQVRRVEESFWMRYSGDGNAFISTAILGTRAASRPSQSNVTYVAVRFARDTAYREFVWDTDGLLVDYGPISRGFARRFYPGEAGCYVSFDIASPVIKRLCAEPGMNALVAEISVPQRSPVAHRFVRAP